MYRVKLMQYPNHETRLVLSKLPPPGDPYKEKVPTPVNDRVDSNQNVLVNQDDCLVPSLTLAPNSTPVENCFGAPSKPGFGDIPRYTAFGNNARRTILRCGGVLDEIVTDPKHIVFLTGTIPNGYDDGRITASAYSSWLVQQLKLWIGKHVQSKLDFYVWEYQKRGALHLHYCVYAPRDSSRNKILRGFHKVWVRLLLRLSSATGVDMCYSSPRGTNKDKTDDIQAYAQEIRASAAAYLAKYTSKEAGQLVSRDSRRLYPPTRWWGCSRPLLRELRNRTKTVESHTISRRQAESQYEDVSTLLHSTSDRCYDYKDTSGRASITVAYRTATIGLEQCQILMRDTKMSTQSQNGQTTAESVITSLKAIIRTSGLAPVNYCQRYSPYSEQALNELLHSKSPSIIAVMEVLNATQYLLWSTYQNRPRRPVWYERAQRRLELSLAWILARRAVLNPSILLPLQTLD